MSSLSNDIVKLVEAKLAGKKNEPILLIYAHNVETGIVARQLPSPPHGPQATKPIYRIEWWYMYGILLEETLQDGCIIRTARGHVVGHWAMTSHPRRVEAETRRGGIRIPPFANGELIHPRLPFIPPLEIGHDWLFVGEHPVALQFGQARQEALSTSANLMATEPV